MAEDLGIKRCWFHAKPYAHYDVPKKRIDEVLSRVEVIGSRELLRIIKGALSAEERTDHGEGSV